MDRPQQQRQLTPLFLIRHDAEQLASAYRFTPLAQQQARHRCKDNPELLVKNMEAIGQMFDDIDRRRIELADRTAEFLPEAFRRLGLVTRGHGWRMLSSERPDWAQRLVLELSWLAKEARLAETIGTRAASPTRDPGADDSHDARGKHKEPIARTRISAKEANVAAREYLRRYPGATARELCKEIGCSLGLVSTLPVWKAIQEQGQESKLPKPKKPRAVTLTGKLEQTVGADDKELQRLIAESEADNRSEPSPLELDPSAGPPRRPRERKSL